MTKESRHRPRRVFENAERLIIECDISEYPHCCQPLKPHNNWHMCNTVQTLRAPVIVGGKNRECANPDCSHIGKQYYARRALMISLPRAPTAWMYWLLLVGNINMNTSSW